VNVSSGACVVDIDNRLTMPLTRTNRGVISLLHLIISKLIKFTHSLSDVPMVVVNLDQNSRVQLDEVLSHEGKGLLIGTPPCFGKTHFVTTLGQNDNKYVINKKAYTYGKHGRIFVYGNSYGETKVRRVFSVVDGDYLVSCLLGWPNSNWCKENYKTEYWWDIPELSVMIQNRNGQFLSALAENVSVLILGTVDATEATVRITREELERNIERRKLDNKRRIELGIPVQIEESNALRLFWQAHENQFNDKKAQWLTWSQLRLQLSS